MSINLVQWKGSTVTPKLDAIMYDDGSYGIIKGCAITHQGTNLLKIANGFIKIAGRLIEIAEETIQCQVSASGTVNGQLWLRLDLSSVTPAVFMTEAAAVLTPLTQNADCNFQNGIYELQLATYNIDESVITNLVETAPELERLRTALDNIDLAANKVTYDNTHSGLSANKVQGAIDEINDNLSGFKFYPTGTDLVAFVADDSFYTDTDGNYILADSTTGQTLLEDTATYKALASTEDCRGEVGADTAIPFKSGGFKNVSDLLDDAYTSDEFYYKNILTFSSNSRYMAKLGTNEFSKNNHSLFISVISGAGAGGSSTYYYTELECYTPIVDKKFTKVHFRMSAKSATWYVSAALMPNIMKIAVQNIVTGELEYLQNLEDCTVGTEYTVDIPQTFLDELTNNLMRLVITFGEYDKNIANTVTFDILEFVN